MSSQRNGFFQRRGCGGAILALALALSAAGCGNKFEDTKIVRPPGSTKLGFADRDVASLGRIEGPYVFMKCVSPTLILLADTHAKTEYFRLIGLCDGLYPEPALPPQKTSQGAPTPTPAPARDPATLMKRLSELYQSKMDGLTALCDKQQIWVIRMTRQSPSLAYVFIPDGALQADKPATGQATLVNAQVLRQGEANLDLLDPNAVNQPLFDVMLESQLVGLIEIERKGAERSDIWARFNLKLPPGPWNERLEELKKRM